MAESVTLKVKATDVSSDQISTSVVVIVLNRCVRTSGGGVKSSGQNTPQHSFVRTPQFVVVRYILTPEVTPDVATRCHSGGAANQSLVAPDVHRTFIKLLTCSTVRGTLWPLVH